MVSLMLLPFHRPDDDVSRVLKFVSGRGAVRVVYYLYEQWNSRLVRAFFDQQASPVMGIQTPCEML